MGISSLELHQLRASEIHKPRARGRLAHLESTARGIAADLATSEGCTALVAAAPAPDIEPADFFETEDAVCDRHWQVNVMAGVRFVRAYLPGGAERGWGRHVIA